MPALPWSVVGFVGVALLWRARPLRLLIATALAIFAIDGLIFPVARLQGTFLHGSIPALALLAIGAAWVGLLPVDAVSRFGAGRDLAAVGGVVLATGLLVVTTFESSGYARWANGVPSRYEALAAGLAAAGLSDAVVIASHPSWAWREAGHASIVLPDEDAASTLSLAKAYGATVVTADGIDGPWPDAAATTACLVPIDLPPAASPMMAFRVVCTGPWASSRPNADEVGGNRGCLAGTGAPGDGHAGRGRHSRPSTDGARLRPDRPGPSRTGTAIGRATAIPGEPTCESRPTSEATPGPGRG